MRLVGRWNLVALDSVLHSEEQDSRLILCRFHGSLTVYSLFILNRLGDDDDDDDDGDDDDDDVDDDDDDEKGISGDQWHWGLKSWDEKW